MGLWKPDPPEPPNPMATAAAQTGTNVSTAVANSYLGNVNQVTPQGNLTNDVTGTYTFTDPTNGQTYNIPRWTQTQSLTPQGQQAFNNQQNAQVNLSGMANQQSGALSNLFATPFNANQGAFNSQAYLQSNPDVMAAAIDEQRRLGTTLNDFAARHYREYGQGEGRTSGFTNPAPAAGDINLLNWLPNPNMQINPTTAEQFGYGSGGAIQYGFDPSGAIRQSYGNQDNFEAERARVEQGLMQRLNPQLQLEQQRLRQQLADQGINAGQQAFSNAYDVYNRQANDARLAVIGQGGVEQQRLNQMAQAQATFENMAQAQGFSQAQARAMFNNQAQQQAEAQAAARGAFYNQAAQDQFAQEQARAQFGNTAIAQLMNMRNTQFNAQNLLRNQALTEGYQQRAQPLNEISALLSGSQVQQPNFRNIATNQIPTTDVAGLINQNFAQQNDIYKTGLSSWNDVMGGILGAGGRLGGAALGNPALMSDRNVKENIDPLGTVFSDKGDKLPIYQYSYKDDPASTRHVGPMAQDVEKVDPDAVREIGGVKHIDLNRMGSIFGRGIHA